MLPLEALYAAVTALRRLLYRRGLLRRGHPGCPVIVVGNLSVGGTGKTPAVMELAGELTRRGHAVAVVCRGYGGRETGVRRVNPETDDAREVGDEALLLARQLACPVYIGRARLDAARRAHGDGARVIVCDDGLQHYALGRDVEVVVVDASEGFGNGHLLPVGPLREPRQRLATVDFLLERGGRDAHTAMEVAPRCYRSLDGSQTRELEAPGFGPAVHAIAGIARPERFFETLRCLGLEPEGWPLRDHEAAPEALFAGLADKPLLMTGKDAVKYPASVHPDAWILEMGVRFPTDFVATLLRRAGLAPGGDA
jgi:tetraacyldisaccharide 4'-kinase